MFSSTIYCSKECQVSEWKKEHKKNCKLFVKSQYEKKILNNMVKQVEDLQQSNSVFSKKLEKLLCSSSPKPNYVPTIELSIKDKNFVSFGWGKNSHMNIKKINNCYTGYLITCKLSDNRNLIQEMLTISSCL